MRVRNFWIFIIVQFFLNAGQRFKAMEALYPIEQIIQFDQHGQSVAFCHADKRPSLTWYKAKNRATCFPCGKSYNPIDVLIQRDGYSFRDAVMQLAA
jgi:CHC2 zinc finger